MEDDNTKTFLDKYWTPENEKAFWKEMKICKGSRADGKDGKCVDVDAHNHGCIGCYIEAGLAEPKELI